MASTKEQAHSFHLEISSPVQYRSIIGVLIWTPHMAHVLGLFRASIFFLSNPNVAIKVLSVGRGILENDQNRCL